MLLLHYFCIVGTQIIFLGNVQSFVVLTANIADIKKLAEKFVSESLAEKLTNIVSHVTGYLANENNPSDKLYDEDDKLEPKSQLKTNEGGETIDRNEQSKYDDDAKSLTVKTKSVDPISYENLKYGSIERVRGIRKPKEKKKRFESKALRQSVEIPKKREYHLKQQNPYIFDNKQDNGKLEKKPSKNSKSKHLANKVSIIDTKSVETGTKIKKDHETDETISSSKEDFERIKLKDKNELDNDKVSNEDSHALTQEKEDELKIQKGKLLQDFSDDELTKEYANVDSPISKHGNEEQVRRATLTTLKGSNEFDQYDNINNPKVDLLATSGGVALTKQDEY